MPETGRSSRLYEADTTGRDPKEILRLDVTWAVKRCPGRVPVLRQLWHSPCQLADTHADPHLQKPLHPAQFTHRLPDSAGGDSEQQGGGCERDTQEDSVLLQIGDCEQSDYKGGWDVA